MRPVWSKLMPRRPLSPSLLLGGTIISTMPCLRFSNVLRCRSNVAFFRTHPLKTRSHASPSSSLRLPTSPLSSPCPLPSMIAPPPSPPPTSPCSSLNVASQSIPSPPSPPPASFPIPLLHRLSFSLSASFSSFALFSSAAHLRRVTCSSSFARDRVCSLRDSPRPRRKSALSYDICASSMNLFFLSSFLSSSFSSSSSCSARRFSRACAFVTFFNKSSGRASKIRLPNSSRSASPKPASMPMPDAVVKPECALPAPKVVHTL